jgi:lipoprotein-releasing system permease protein
MRLVFSIAKRYLFGIKSATAINVITWLSIVGIAVGTAALILILSVFNGFEKLLVENVGGFHSDLKVLPKNGLYLQPDQKTLNELKSMQEIANISLTLEEVALFEYSSSQEAGFIKGVDENFTKVNAIESVIHTGEYIVEDSAYNYGILGNGMYNKLSVSVADPFNAISVYVPETGGGPLSTPFKVLDLYPKGVFNFGGEQDHQYIITNLSFVRALKNLTNEISSIEIKMKDGGQEKAIRKKISVLFKNEVIVKNRYEMDEAFLKIMNIERWVSFLIAVLTLGIISFNMVGSLWMIVLDKKKDISILKSMGMTSTKIKMIFKSIGLLIGITGFVSGFFIAVVLYVLQKKYDLISVPDGFMITGYPVHMKPGDVILVLFVVLCISLIASLLPANRAGKITAFVRQE